MSARTLSLAIVGLALVANTAHAVVLCAKARSDGTYNTSVKIRESCKVGETQLDAADLGVQGPAGINGSAGLNCWDANASGTCDAAEDRTGDAQCTADDCLGGPAGPAGPEGPQGPPGGTVLKDAGNAVIGSVIPGPVSIGWMGGATAWLLRNIDSVPVAFPVVRADAFADQNTLQFETEDCTGTAFIADILYVPATTIFGGVGIPINTAADSSGFADPEPVLFYSTTPMTSETVLRSLLYFADADYCSVANDGLGVFTPPNECCLTYSTPRVTGALPVTSTFDLGAFTPPFHVEFQ